MNKYKGIYGYLDTYNSTSDKPVYDYIGKDKNLWKKWRHKEHGYPSHKYLQPFNTLYQNNKNRWKYVELLCLSEETTDDELNYFETMYYNIYKPRFTYYVGLETPQNEGENNPNYRHDLRRYKYYIALLYTEYNLNPKRIAEFFNVNHKTIRKIIHSLRLNTNSKVRNIPRKNTYIGLIRRKNRPMQFALYINSNRVKLSQFIEVIYDYALKEYNITSEDLNIKY